MFDTAWRGGESKDGSDLFVCTGSRGNGEEMKNIKMLK